MLKNLRKINITVLFVLIAGVLVYRWFGNNMLLAVGEEGLPFYNPIRTFSLYKEIWVEQGFGIASPFYIPRLILYGCAAVLYLIGLPAWFIQATVFFLLLITPLLTIPHLVKTLFPQQPVSFRYIASLFYVFNLYTLSQVWERFIYPLMFLWSFLPLFLLIWIYWVDTRRVKYLLLLVFVSILYADAFGLTSSMITLSFAAMSYVFNSTVKDGIKLRPFGAGVIGYFVWVLFQIWWIHPIFVLRNNSYASFLNIENTLASLKGVSVFFPTSQIIFLKQNYFFGPSNFLSYFYDKSLIFVLSLLILGVVIVGILISLKEKAWRYLMILFLVGWFVSKGYNSPLGQEFYTFLFSTFSFTQTLRNPYEKFGVIFLLPYSIFFSYGLVWISQRLKKLQYIFLITVSIIVFGVYVWPIWTGDVFTGSRIKVPSYYEEANVYLNTFDDRRILMLPLLQEPTITYHWGYRGEEPSEFLFDRPSLSRSDFGLPVDGYYLSLPGFLNEKNFTKLLGLASVSNVIIRKDTIQNTYNQSSIYDYLSHSEKWSDIKKTASFGDLEIYTLNKERVNQWVYAADSVIGKNTIEEGMKLVISEQFDIHSDLFIITGEETTIDIPKRMVLPQITFKKITPSNYIVQVNNAKEPFVLVLSVAYNPLWKANIGNESVSKHFKTNAYSNGWVIKEKGTYEVELSFAK